MPITLEEIARKTIAYGHGDIIITVGANDFVVRGFLRGHEIIAVGETILDGMQKLVEKMEKGIVEPLVFE